MRDRVCVVTGATASAGVWRWAWRGSAPGGSSWPGARSGNPGRRRRSPRRPGTPRWRSPSPTYASLDSVARAAGEIRRRQKRLHVLVNAAGRLLRAAGDRRRPRGQLRGRLPRRLPPAPAPPPGSSTSPGSTTASSIPTSTTSSRSAASGPSREPRHPKVVFTVELARRLAGRGVTDNGVHPEAIRTDLLREMPWSLVPQRGADNGVYLGELSGRYFIRRRPVAPSPTAQDPEVGRRLFGGERAGLVSPWPSGERSRGEAASPRRRSTSPSRS